MSYQQQKSDFDEPKYCQQLCGSWIWFIKSPDGKTKPDGKPLWIPGEYGTNNPHECPRNSKSRRYEPSYSAVLCDENTRPATISRSRKKSYNPRVEPPAQVIPQDRQMLPPQPGVTSDQINSILIEVRKCFNQAEKTFNLIEQQVMTNQKYHSQLLELVAEVLKPGPTSALHNLQESYAKAVNEVTGQEVTLSDDINEPR